MVTCPNCNYKLVLLSNRRKYKCAKCSKLFLQKSIEDKEFRRWNKFQKELDIYNLNLQLKRIKLSPEEKLKRIREWRKKNLKKLREYWAINKDKINTKRRQIYIKKKEHFKTIKIARRYKNIELTRLQGRIDFWKQKQKTLADNILKNKQYGAYNTEITHSVPTFLHCEQLKPTKSL